MIKENTPKRTTAQLAAEYSELLERHEDYDFSLTGDERWTILAKSSYPYSIVI